MTVLNNINQSSLMNETRHAVSFFGRSIGPENIAINDIVYVILRPAFGNNIKMI